MLKSLSLSLKLTAATSVLLALTALLGFSGLNSLTGSKHRFDHAIDGSVKGITLADAALNANTEMISAQRGIILAAFGKDAKELANYRQTFENDLAVMRSTLKSLQPLLRTDQAKALGADMMAKNFAWEPHFRDVVARASEGNVDEANRIRKDITAPLYKAIDKDARQLAAMQKDDLVADQAALARQYGQDWLISATLLSVFAVVAVLVVVIIRQATSSVGASVQQLFAAASQVGTAAHQVSTNSQALAKGSTEQAASLEETSASTQQINAMSRQNNLGSQTAAELVAQSQEKFERANTALQGMLAAMNEINVSSEKVSKIIKVIDQIAFQTNILALNAAVEAARAGNAGLGFAVVADEVRSLAQRSAQAAKDTSALIEESLSKSNDGRIRVDQVAAAIRSATEESHKIKALVDDVKSGSQEQVLGLEQVSKAIVEMERVTQSTAATAEENASAAEELTAQSVAMNDIVSRLSAIVGKTGRETIAR